VPRDWNLPQGGADVLDRENHLDISRRLKLERTALVNTSAGGQRRSALIIDGGFSICWREQLAQHRSLVFAVHESWSTSIVTNQAR
jgi:hypothetical protein